MDSNQPPQSAGQHTDTDSNDDQSESKSLSRNLDEKPECSKEVATCSQGQSEDGSAVGGIPKRPNTVEEFLKMDGATQMFAIEPLTWCPHLKEVQPLPPAKGLNSGDPCSVCGDRSENWVCLVCYTVSCSRFVNEHMLYHRLESEHNLCLSYSDLSVWCYACDHYVDNKVLFPMKNAAHQCKFGETLSGAH